MKKIIRLILWIGLVSQSLLPQAVKDDKYVKKGKEMSATYGKHTINAHRKKEKKTLHGIEEN